MADKDNNIPTLTTVIQQGDPSMQNHFDQQQLNDEPATIPTAVENASSYENEDADVPSLQLNDEADVELPQQDFSEAMQQRLVEIDSQPEAAAGDSESIKQSIDEAIAEIIPQIEDHLRKTLYKKFDA